jgi:hypothetical protein
MRYGRTTSRGRALAERLIESGGRIDVNHLPRCSSSSVVSAKLATFRLDKASSCASGFSSLLDRLYPFIFLYLPCYSSRAFYSWRRIGQSRSRRSGILLGHRSLPSLQFIETLPTPLQLLHHYFRLPSQNDFRQPYFPIYDCSYHRMIVADSRAPGSDKRPHQPIQAVRLPALDAVLDAIDSCLAV